MVMVMVTKLVLDQIHAENVQSFNSGKLKAVNETGISIEFN